MEVDHRLTSRGMSGTRGKLPNWLTSRVGDAPAQYLTTMEHMRTCFCTSGVLRPGLGGMFVIVMAN
jgi:hypothetical protein